jgi:hypothetical protein
VACIYVDVYLGIDVDEIVVVVVFMTEVPLAQGVVSGLANRLNGTLDTVLVCQQPSSLGISVTVVDGVNICVDLDICLDIKNVVTVTEVLLGVSMTMVDGINIGIDLDVCLDV